MHSQYRGFCGKICCMLCTVQQSISNHAQTKPLQHWGLLESNRNSKDVLQGDHQTAEVEVTKVTEAIGPNDHQSTSNESCPELQKEVGDQGGAIRILWQALHPKEGQKCRRDDATNERLGRKRNGIWQIAGDQCTNSTYSYWDIGPQHTGHTRRQPLVNTKPKDDAVDGWHEDSHSYALICKVCHQAPNTDFYEKSSNPTANFHGVAFHDALTGTLWGSIWQSFKKLLPAWKRAILQMEMKDTSTNQDHPAKEVKYQEKQKIGNLTPQDQKLRTPLAYWCNKNESRNLVLICTQLTYVWYISKFIVNDVLPFTRFIFCIRRLFKHVNNC